MNEFPHLITIQKMAKVPDGSGGHVEDWVTFKEVNAHVQPISGDSFFKAQQIESKINHKVFIDYDNTITNNARLIFEDKILTVNSIIDQGGLNELMVLMCVGN